jgi:hypothetical protein
LAELEPEEDDLLRTPIGKAAPQAVVDAVWRAEGAQVLLWALSQRELPAHDTQEHPFALAKEAGLLQEVRPQILGASLRSVAQLEAMRLRLAALHWRLVEARLCPSKLVEFAKFTTRDFMKGVDLSGLPMVDGDLAFQGNAVSRLDQAAIQLGQSIAKERHQAANWLLGVHPVYSLVNTPT